MVIYGVKYTLIRRLTLSPISALHVCLLTIADARPPPSAAYVLVVTNAVPCG